MCLLADLANRGIAGHSVGRARDAGLVPGAFATLDFPLADVLVFRTDRCGEFATRGSTSCSTCSASKDRCRARAIPTATPWSNRRTGC